jgi:hypothetical protein
MVYIKNAKSFTLCDAFGKVILRGECSAMHQLDLSAFTKGMYLLSVVDDDGEERTYKFRLM